MKSGFYPFCGPAGKDSSSKPYPKWYYPNADGAGTIVHSVQQYLEAVDTCYRIVFSGKFRVKNPEMWFLSRRAETSTILPAFSETDEQTLVSRFAEDAFSEDDRPYPEILFHMYAHGVYTRLLEWSFDALAVLKNAVGLRTEDAQSPVDSVIWCMNPCGLNKTAGFDGNHAGELIPDGCDPNTGPLFTGESSLTTARPFAAFGPAAGGRPSVFTVFPISAETVPIEMLPESPAFLSKLIIPASAGTLISEQLRRYGL